MRLSRRFKDKVTANTPIYWLDGWHYKPVDDQGEWRCPMSAVPGHISGGDHCVDCHRPIHYPR